MALTNQEIERYSRQIIMSSGVAQERLRAAHVVAVGAAATIEPALRYLAGAGVGRIGIDLTDADDATRDRLVARIRALDSSIVIDSQSQTDTPDLVLTIVTDETTLAQAERWGRRGTAIVIARLIAPMEVVVLAGARRAWPSAEAALRRVLLPLIPPTESAVNPGFVTMVAVNETLQLLMAEVALAEPVTIEFVGYQTRVHRLASPASR